MAAQARLALQGGTAFDFVAGKTVGGRIPDYPIAVLEDISCDGIDYARRRLNARRFRPFQYNTMAEATDYATAVNLARLYERSIGGLGTLSTTIRGQTYTYAVIVVDVAPPVIMAGAPLGSNVSTGKTSGVTAQWLLELVSIPAGL